MKQFASAAIRVAREQRGIGDGLLPQLFRDGELASTLLLSPPGGGKTTLLRDLVRGLSEGIAPYGPRRVALIPMVLRAMNPQVIAVDEITVREDLQAVSQAAGCGVRLLATIHAGGVGELLERPLYRRLLEDKVFRLAVCISREGGARSYTVEELP